MGDPLILEQVPDSLWLDFHARPEALEERHPGPRLLECWTRARDLGASVDGTQPEDQLIRNEALRMRMEENEPLAELGRAVLERAEAEFAPRGYVLLLSDADGVVVRAAGGGEFAREAKRVRLIEGAVWSEAARGTNAIGTAIAEAQPVYVHGRAHYGRRYHGLVCYAAPILDPNGALIGVLDATSFVEKSDETVARGVLAAAEALQAIVRMHAYATAGAAVARVLGRALERMTSPVVWVEQPGRIARLNAAARVELGAVAAGSAVNEVLGLDWSALLQEALTPRPGGRVVSMTVGGANKRYRLHVDPVETQAHGVFSLLVYLEPATLSLARAPTPVLRPLKAPPLPADPFARLFAEDAAMKSALAWARRIAKSELPVMLLAETGAGKELVAEAIHAASDRAAGPFVAMNCGSIAPSLLESELFGYAPGAFTGAERRGREGMFHAASGGTLFLDEVAEMPAAMQTALLRVLESGVYRRVGDTQSATADVRIVCATCRDLERMVAEGTFRKDLYYRLKGGTVTLPPLRARTDVVALAKSILGHLSERSGRAGPDLSAEVSEAFSAHAWPGNVRELKSTLEVALVLAAGAEQLQLEHLPPDFESRPRTEAGVEEAALDQVEAQAVKKAIAETPNNLSAVAKRLGVARSTLYRMMRRYGLQR